MSPTGNRTVNLEGRGPLVLRPSNYVATGGEGSVFRASDLIVKLYTDAGKMRRDGMLEKIRLLSQLKHPYIVAPSGIATDERNEPIGYYMPYADAEPLSRVFTTAFWNRERFGAAEALTLVDRMRDTVRTAHDYRAVMVDANELNWLAFLKGKKGPEPRAIDVDSWAVGKWNASVIMPSIRDWHARAFSAETDWFAYGIVSFQVLTGIHPYRGTLDGYKSGDLEGRMKANASVFQKGVSLNRAVRDFGSIPAPLLDWYVATFQNGERSIPPSPFDKGIAAIAKPALVHRKTVSGGGTLVFDQLFARVGDAITRIYPCGLALLSSGALIELASKREALSGLGTAAEAVRAGDGWLVGQMQGNVPAFTYVDARTYAATPLPFMLHGTRLFRFENRMFLVTEDELVELSLLMVGKPLVAIGKRTQILRPNATQWFDGIGVQKAFDATFLVLPFGDSALATVRVRELDGQTPIAALAGNRYAAVVSIDKSGAYHRFEFTFTGDYAAYIAASVPVDSPDLNLTLLPKGVGAMIAEDGELTIFVPTNGQQRVITDKHIATDMALAHIGDQVVYAQNDAVWAVKMS